VTGLAPSPHATLNDATANQPAQDLTTRTSRERIKLFSFL
jgi:hypothetical protein